MNKPGFRSVAGCHAICTIFDLLGLHRHAKPGDLAEIVRELEKKFPYNRTHSNRVVQYAKLIAGELPIPDMEMATICRAACLHDLGKVEVPREILNKPGALTGKERGLIEKHPEAAARLLRKSLYPEECVDLVLYHHEWFNGKGYPTHALGTNIPLGARVIAVADAFDAMTSDRPYRKAMSVAHAKKELYDCAGSQFDPEVVEALDRAQGIEQEIEDRD